MVGPVGGLKTLLARLAVIPISCIGSVIFPRRKSIRCPLFWILFFYILLYILKLWQILCDVVALELQILKDCSINITDKPFYSRFGKEKPLSIE